MKRKRDRETYVEGVNVRRRFDLHCDDSHGRAVRRFVPDGSDDLVPLGQEGLDKAFTDTRLIGLPPFRSGGSDSPPVCTADKDSGHIGVGLVELGSMNA